jgi:hypothetical protein
VWEHFVAERNIRRFELMMRHPMNDQRRALIQELLDAERLTLAAWEDGRIGPVGEPRRH